MLRKDKLINGLIFGMLLPILGFIFFYQVFKILDLLGAADGTGLASNFRERTIAIVAIALNIIPMRIFAARRVNNSIRGVVIATFLLAAAWFWQYGMKML